MLLRTNQVHFSQNTIGPVTRLDGQPIGTEELAKRFADARAYLSEPIDVVRFPGGRLVSYDNRRLWAARVAGLTDIPAVVYDHDEPMGTKTRERHALRTSLWQVDGVLTQQGPKGDEFYVKGTRPKTHGEAITFRTATPHRLIDAASFPVDGSLELPRLRGDRQQNGLHQPRTAIRASEARTPLRLPHSPANGRRSAHGLER